MSYLIIYCYITVKTLLISIISFGFIVKKNDHLHFEIGGKGLFFWVKSQQRVENSRSLRQVREMSAATNKNKNKQTNKQTNKQKEGRNAR